MIIASLDELAREMIVHELTSRPNEVLIAFDPVDQAFKFKINQGVWSPPLGTFRQPGNPTLRSFVTELREFIHLVARNAVK